MTNKRYNEQDTNERPIHFAALNTTRNGVATREQDTTIEIKTEHGHAMIGAAHYSTDYQIVECFVGTPAEQDAIPLAEYLRRHDAPNTWEGKGDMTDEDRRLDPTYVAQLRRVKVYRSKDGKTFESWAKTWSTYDFDAGRHIVTRIGAGASGDLTLYRRDVESAKYDHDAGVRYYRREVA